ncbi:MAG: hypothetical protein H6740_25220 [Alphaproteobacteria bacterium]|nr:hypothetical protein [Alphaproteobacteria bacterium]
MATVDASGVVTAVGAGEVSERRAEGLTASATLVVQEVSDLYVRVVDANSGEPIPNARVTWLGREAVTDANGEGSVGVTAGTPITLTAFLPESDYIPASVINVIARDIVMPLRPSSEEAEAPAGLSGGVDYAGVVEAEWDEQVVGLVGPSLQRSPCSSTRASSSPRPGGHALRRARRAARQPLPAKASSTPGRPEPGRARSGALDPRRPPCP